MRKNEALDANVCIIAGLANNNRIVDVAIVIVLDMFAAESNRIQFILRAEQTSLEIEQLKLNDGNLWHTSPPSATHQGLFIIRHPVPRRDYIDSPIYTYEYYGLLPQLLKCSRALRGCGSCQYLHTYIQSIDYALLTMIICRIYAYALYTVMVFGLELGIVAHTVRQHMAKGIILPGRASD